MTLTWAELLRDVTRLANVLRAMGVGQGDTVAYVLPNGIEAPVAFLAGATAGIVAPINPTLSAEHMGALLRELRAKVVITLAPFAKSEVAETVAAAIATAPCVESVLRVDLGRYLPVPLRWVAALARPKMVWPKHVRLRDWSVLMKDARTEALDFAEGDPERYCAVFHTGGTTGLPKLARHRARGMLYNGWCGRFYMFGDSDVLLCQLPMFHVFAAYPVFMSCLMSGAMMVMVTPQGFRGEGVFKNFWHLVESWGVTFIVMVPTAAAKLAQVPVDADITSLRLAFCGSAPLARDLFLGFEAKTGMRICEGYGMTEATCLVSVNPPDGERRIGSVGLPFAYTEVSVRGGADEAEMGPDEPGEICVRGPGVTAEVYADAARNAAAMTADGFLRTGDLGRMDADGYIWITGRAKDLIIRGGHNIDPALIEEALMAHPEVVAVAAIGQPDAHSGEVPVAYVELVAGAAVTAEALLGFAKTRIGEAAACPRRVELRAELPLTAVGKIYKPELRRLAIATAFDAALAEAGLRARVARVVEDRRLGLVAELAPGAEGEDVGAALGAFAVPWRWRAEA